MKRMINNFIIVILLFGLTNCSSSYFTLAPDEESNYEMGRKVIEKKTDEIYSVISLEEQSESEYIFHLYVKNIGEDKILIDPKYIYFKIFDEDKNLITSDKIYALDPEEQIKLVNRNMKERKDDHEVNTGLNIVFGLISTIADLSDGDDENDIGDVAENVLIFSGNQINEEISYKEDIHYLKDEKAYWKNEVLRKTNLHQDEEIGGAFYIPLMHEAKYIKLFVPLGKTIHSYKFRQIEKEY